MNVKKAIIIGLLSASIIGLGAFALKYKEYSPKITETYAEELETANGYWHFNETISNLTPTGTNVNSLTPSTAELYSLNYTTISNASYTRLEWRIDTNEHTYGQLGYRSTNTQVAYNFNTNTWTSENRRTINITGGADTTNPLIIQWLKANAIKLVDNFTMTTWRIKETPEDIPAGYYSKLTNIKFKINGYTATGFQLGYSTALTETANCIRIAGQVIYNNGTWLNDTGGAYRQYSTFIIEEIDTTDLKLSLWFYKNATQYNTLTSLNNTQWQIVQNPGFPLDKNIEINFTSNGEVFKKLSIYNSDQKIKYTKYVNPTNTFEIYNEEVVTAYNTTYWTNNNYQKITITNEEGTSTTSLESISWFISNAKGTKFTPIPINDNNYDIENGNFTSLQELMLRILTLPFTFIAQAFDITLWPNTAWEFNLSNFILGIIAIATILFIIKLFTSGFAVIGNYTNNHTEREYKRSQTRLNESKANLNNRTKPNEKHIYTHKD